MVVNLNKRVIIKMRMMGDSVDGFIRVAEDISDFRIKVDGGAILIKGLRSAYSSLGGVNKMPELRWFTAAGGIHLPGLVCHFLSFPGEEGFLDLISKSTKLSD